MGVVSLNVYTSETISLLVVGGRVLHLIALVGASDGRRGMSQIIVPPGPIISIVRSLGTTIGLYSLARFSPLGLFSWGVRLVTLAQYEVN